MKDLRYLLMKGEWYQLDYQFKESDALVRRFLDVPTETGWIRRAREALFLSMDSVAIRMDASKSTFANFERGEERISIANLRKCAEAMDCDLVYAIRPKEGAVFSERIWQAVSPNAPDLHWVRTRMYRPGYRHMHGWHRNRGGTDPDVRQVMNADRANRDWILPSLSAEQIAARQHLADRYWAAVRQSMNV